MRWRGNAWAVDVVAVEVLGLRATGIVPADSVRYLSFGRPVATPCGGTVVVSVDDQADLALPKSDVRNRAGNHIILECHGAHVVMAHLRRGFLLVTSGESVQEGQLLAHEGNAVATDEPHLHIHAQRPGRPWAPMGGDPIPITFDGRFLLRGQRIELP